MGQIVASPNSKMSEAPSSSAPASSALSGVELSLYERERELEEARRIARLGTWRWEKATDTLTWSREVFEIYGCDPAQPVPRREAAQKLMPPESWERISAAVERSFATGEPYETDIEVLHASGERRWVLARGKVAERSDDGEVLVLRGTVQDITERKRMELALRDREAELQESQRISQMGTWGMHVPSGEVRWSPQVYRVFGADPSGPPLMPPVLDAMFLNGSYGPMAEGFERCCTSGEPYEVDAEIVGLDGVRRWIAARGEVATRDAEGRILTLRGTLQDITERKRTELALRDRERERDEAHRIAKLGTWRWSVPSGEWEWSPEIYTIFGFDPANGMPGGEELAAMFAPEVWDRLLAAMKLAATEGVPYEMDLEVQGADGVNRWFSTQGRPAVLGPGGEVLELRGTVQDITERKRSELALQESQSRFQKLYDANILGICYPDKYGAFFDGNDEFLRIVGYTRGELQAGKVRWDALTPPEYAELDAQHIAEAAERGRCTPYEKEYVRKDGKRVPILCGYALLEGSADRYIAFVSDLTPQKQAEQAIRDREKRFRDLAESLPELVWESAAEGHVTYVNQSFRAFTGYGMGQVEGREVFEVVHPEDRDRALAKWQHSVATGEPYENELRMRRADGAYRSLLSRAVAIRSESGEIERWLGTATDIHDQRLADEVVRRTEKLAATGRLAASMAHEINNPLESVMNALYLALQDGGLRAETRAFLQTADRELQRVAHVTTQTLRFHRQSRGPAEECLERLMESAVSLFEGRMVSREIALQREYGATTTLFCCGDELRQVFANLLSNAIDATNPGGRLRVRVRAAHAWNEGMAPGIRVSLGDTGQGIPQDLLEKVFEPFMTTKDATGTGLGLWVSSGIVQKHRGRISLRSKVGQGTVFSLFFPLDGIS